MEIVPHRFRASDLIGGHVVLDFINTVTARDEIPLDWLDRYPRLLEWAAWTGEFDARTLAALRARSLTAPRDADRSLARARSLREALFSVFLSLARKRAPPPGALAVVERRWKQAVRASTLASSGSGTTSVLELRGAGLDSIAFQVALRAIRLLEELPAGRMRLCAGSACAWLFLDSSKGGRRRWCDMATCGNVAKARAYYQRRKKSA